MYNDNQFILPNNLLCKEGLMICCSNLSLKYLLARLVLHNLVHTMLLYRLQVDSHRFVAGPCWLHQFQLLSFL